MTSYTAEFVEAAKFSNENVALIACDRAVSEIDAIFEPIKVDGAWVVRLTDYATGDGFLGYLAA